MGGMGKKAFEPHLMKSCHHLIEPLPRQLGCTFHSCHPFEDMVVRLVIETEILLGDMNQGLLLATNAHPQPHFYYKSNGIEHEGAQDRLEN
jgi:hypothetical protein